MAEDLIGEFLKFLADDALRIVEIEAINHFQNRFRYARFTDQSPQKWPKRKAPRKKRGNRQATKHWNAGKPAMQANTISVFVMQNEA